MKKQREKARLLAASAAAGPSETTARSEATEGWGEVENGPARVEPIDDGKIDGVTPTIPEQLVRKFRGIPEDVKLFEVFWHQIVELIKVSSYSLISFPSLPEPQFISLLNAGSTRPVDSRYNSSPRLSRQPLAFMLPREIRIRRPSPQLRQSQGRRVCRISRLAPSRHQSESTLPPPCTDFLLLDRVDAPGTSVLSRTPPRSALQYSTLDCQRYRRFSIEE